MSPTDLQAKALANMLREAGHVLQGAGYKGFAEQIDAILVNYGFEGLQCPVCGEDHEGNVPLACETGDGE